MVALAIVLAVGMAARNEYQEWKRRKALTPKQRKIEDLKSEWRGW
jgi:hypothetical protein